VQVIPHVTNEIKDQSTRRQKATDILITESAARRRHRGLPFLEAMRNSPPRSSRPKTLIFQSRDAVPYVRRGGELKTKPTQQSVCEAP